ncbi:MAG: cell division protein ZapA [Limnohabitans sp.]|jgi:cell division protein ZapA|nr:cell division protein ZapA [Limnohabitans sp.]MDP4732937.1 cell division protein ZapA [Limnohabitans sp.]MDP4771572.1 cell division protein ZapA [Limnohabitans sp.]MDP4922179.1 cell division protein ZapA [Limnohabitans sp.]
MSNRQIDVQIMGQSYILGCPEGGEERLMGAVRKVDEAMCKIRDAGKIKARDRIAVLAALNLAFEQADAPPTIDKDGASTPAAADVPADAQARLVQLLHRLDRVIEQDGQLL